MSQPTAYTRLYNLSTYASNNPAAPYNAAQHDAEFNAVALTLSETLANLGLIQRDDGGLFNGVVTPDSLNTATINMIGDWNPRGAWVTATNYAKLDMVTPTGASLTYVCNTAHTSGATFAAGLVLGYWQLVNGTGSVAGSGVQFTTNDVILGRATAGSGGGEEIVCTAFIRTLLDDVNQGAAQTTLGLGSGSSPTFNLLTVGGLTISGLTAKSMLYSDAAKGVVSTAAPSNGQLLIGSTGNIPALAALTGTANQVIVTNGAGTITLSLPQSIGTGSTPQFTGLNLTGNFQALGDASISGHIFNPMLQASVFDYMTVAQVNDVQARTFTLDVSTPINNALAAGVGRMYPGGYLCNSSVANGSANGLKIEGDGPGATEIRFATRKDGISLTFSNQALPPQVKNLAITTAETMQAVTSITRVGAVATITTTVNHGWTNNDVIAIGGADQTEYNGYMTVTVTGLATATFAVGGVPASPATGTIKAMYAINALKIEMTPTIGTAYPIGPIVDNVEIRGVDPTTGSWSKGYLAKGTWYPSFTRSSIKGYSVIGAAFNNYHTLFGIHFSDVNAPYVQNNSFQHINSNMYDDGTVYACEGYTITGNTVVGGRVGLDFGNGIGTPVPGGWIDDNNFDVSYRGMDLKHRVQSLISNNIVSRTNTTSLAWIGILFTASDSNIVRGTVGTNVSADVTSCNVIWLGGTSKYNIISHVASDSFTAAGACVVLADTASDNVIEASTINPGLTGTVLSKITKAGGFAGVRNVINDFTVNGLVTSQNNYYSGFQRVPGTAGALATTVYSEDVSGLQRTVSDVSGYPIRDLQNFIADTSCASDQFHKARGTISAPAAAANLDNVGAHLYFARNAAGTIKGVASRTVALSAAESANEFGATETLQVSKAGTGLQTVYAASYAGVKMSMRHQNAQGIDVVAANDLALGLDGNSFDITGNTQINRLSNTDFQVGAIVYLSFVGTPTVKHNQAAGGAFKEILLAGAVDFVATANDQLVLKLRIDTASGLQKWYEQSRAVI